MKKKLLSLLLILPLLAGCPAKASEDDVETMPADYVPNLPAYKDKKSGEIKSDGDYVYFDFYEVSDFHGAINRSDKEVGLARLSTYLDAKRESNKGGTVVLSGGDMWQGSADSNLTRGTLVTYGMNVMNFDSMTLGNHEFDWTKDWIENNAGRATFPILAANLIDDSTGKVASFVQSTTILNRGDYKIGVVGTIGDTIRNTIIASATQGLTFANEIETVTSEAQKLRAEGCDIVVWSSHNDAETLKTKVAGADIGVDLVFGGHSHTNYSAENAGVAYLQTAPYGRGIAHAQLKMHKTTKDVSVVTHEVDDKVGQTNYADDQDIVMIKNQYDERFINPVKNIVLGHCDDELKISKELSNLVVYSMKEELKRHDEYKGRNVVAAFHNKNGGVRKDLPAGDITYGNVYETIPFDNEIVILKVKGSALIGSFINGNSNICYWHSYKIDDIKNDEEYEIITTDFLLTNADYYAKVDCEVTYTGLMVRDALANEIKELKTIDKKQFSITRDEYSKDK